MRAGASHVRRAPKRPSNPLIGRRSVDSQNRERPPLWHRLPPSKPRLTTSHSPTFQGQVMRAPPHPRMASRGMAWRVRSPARVGDEATSPPFSPEDGGSSGRLATHEGLQSSRPARLEVARAKERPGGEGEGNLRAGVGSARVAHTVTEGEGWSALVAVVSVVGQARICRAGGRADGRTDADSRNSELW